VSCTLHTDHAQLPSAKAFVYSNLKEVEEEMFYEAV